MKLILYNNQLRIWEYRMVHLKMFFTGNTEIFQDLVILIKKEFTSLALSQDKQIFFPVYMIAFIMYCLQFVIFRISVSRLILMTSLQRESLFCYSCLFKTTFVLHYKKLHIHVLPVKALIFRLLLFYQQKCQKQFLREDENLYVILQLFAS